MQRVILPAAELVTEGFLCGRITGWTQEREYQAMAARKSRRRNDCPFMKAAAL